jgi:hypothetical protein
MNADRDLILVDKPEILLDISLRVSGSAFALGAKVAVTPPICIMGDRMPLRVAI